MNGKARTALSDPRFALVLTARKRNRNDDTLECVRSRNESKAPDEATYRGSQRTPASSPTDVRIA
jgi:hypothetical protein